ncbi:hypothetical protein LK994_09960 [Ferruginibacter lapsinanis]|uniref:Trm112 family protein n=1 Tax=Ferruginibacter lapsinanis TaxID=563172 RepID=UPI001E3A5342|nr:Trm112 family protein [Ferruginibacter lapsinanis]UEG48960.1 hypothetical protein LK994_09960 [Ferruginibacter lapsinanis]
MNIETIKKLCCPFDKADIELTIISQDIHKNVMEGFFTCKECDRIYPIVKGIPIMSPDEYREFKLEQPLIESWKPLLKNKTFENFRLITDENSTV